MSWRHDLIGAGVLVDLYKRGFEVLPELHLRQHAGPIAKLPDGIAIRDDQVIWLETEGARKTGPSMRQLAQALSVVAHGDAAPVLGHKPSHAMVAYAVGATDERGYALSHRKRVQRALTEASHKDVPIIWAHCTLQGAAGIGTVAYTAETVLADKAAKVRRILDAGGWRELDGCLIANYGKHQAAVWEDDDAPGSWGWEAASQADRAPSKEAARQACAGALAAL